MIEEERDCREILQQLSAARSALQGATLVLAEQVIHDCLIVDSAGGEKNQETILDLVELISRI